MTVLRSRRHALVALGAFGLRSVDAVAPGLWYWRNAGRSGDSSRSAAQLVQSSSAARHRGLSATPARPPQLPREPAHLRGAGAARLGVGRTGIVVSDAF